MVSALGVEKQAKREEKKREKSGVWGVMHQYTAWEQIKSGWFIPLSVLNGGRMHWILIHHSGLTNSSDCSRPNAP